MPHGGSFLQIVRYLYVVGSHLLVGVYAGPLGYFFLFHSVGSFLNLTIGLRFGCDPDRCISKEVPRGMAINVLYHVNEN